MTESLGLTAGYLADGGTVGDYQFDERSSLTPGLIWLTTPNQDNDNPDAVIVTLRTTFTF